jgi:hypothetical protein
VKNQLKNYRIVTDKGDSLLIRQESLHCLLQSLELLASSAKHARPVRQPASAQAKK